jgi:hypothetical protein
VPNLTAFTVADFEAAVSGNTAISAEALSDTEVAISTAKLADGDYVVYAVDDGNRISDASGIITIVTYYPPLLSDVTTGSIAPGSNITATSDKDGTIYLVPSSTAVEVTSFEAAVTGTTAVSVAVTAGVEAIISTTGLADGDYLVYAVDVDERISDPSATIIMVSTGLKLLPMNGILLYPNPVKEMLYFKGNMNTTEIVVHDLLGKERIRIENAFNITKINTSGLDGGIYFIKFSDNNRSATYKFIKK